MSNHDLTPRSSSERRKATNPRSGIRHVRWHAVTGTWQVCIQRGDRRGSYGYYRDLDEAARVVVLALDGMMEPGTRGAPLRTRVYTRPTDIGPVHGPAVPPDMQVPSKTSKTGVRGVSFNRQHDRFHVRIRVNGRYESFGLYRTLDQAAEVARQVFAGELEPGGHRRPKPPPPVKPQKQPPPVKHVAAKTTPPPPPRAFPRRPQPSPGFARTDPHREVRTRPMTGLALERARSASLGGTRAR